MSQENKNNLSQNDLATIMETLDEGIVAMTLNGTVTSWNRGAEQIFGYTADEILGKSISTLIPARYIQQKEQVFQKVGHGEAFEIYEAERLRKDGAIVDVSLSFRPQHNDAGKIVGILQICKSISERKRLEIAERDQVLLASIVSSADDAIVSKTLDGIVTSWNPAAQRLYGYTAEEIIGQSISILIPADHPDEEPHILDMIRRGKRIEHYETNRIRKDGRGIDVALTVSPIKDGLDRIIGASKIARDITQQKESEARESAALHQAEKAKQQAERASHAKDEFLATISHELRTPMTAIVGWSRMLIGGQLPPETRQRAIETIDKNARSQAQLIEDLLDISRIVSGKLRVDFKPVDLSTVVHAAVDAVRPTAEAKRIRIQTTLSSGAGPILGDFERLQQVLWNLLSNAVRFTPAEGVVNVELERVESQAQLSVSDNGVGINPEFLPHMFDRFTQADSSLTRSYGGLGMGLAIVKSIVELHGGTVVASSPGVNQGAVFTVKLPLSVVRPEQNKDVARESDVETAWKSQHELVGLKILIVDDQKDTCDLLRHIFDECGAIVETAAGAGEALQLFDRWEPDILISDIGMPQMDGYELIRAIRSNRKSRVPAVALTAMARIDDRVKALTAGFQMHVSKPIEPVELISIVVSLVGLVNRRN